MKRWGPGLAMAITLACACGGDDATHEHDAGGDAAVADGGTAGDAGTGADRSEACPPSGVTVEAATRTTDGGSVTVAATLQNALAVCPKDEVVFEVVFDTHSVDLSAIDVLAASSVETSTGGSVADLSWEPGAQSSHHIDGTLRGSAPPLAGVTWLRLTIRGIAGSDRVFEWDETLLAHDLP